MKLFNIERKEDNSGLSGTGVVAQGVQFDDGLCVVRWLGKLHSTVMYDNIEAVQTIMCSHSKSQLVMLNDQ